MDLSEPPSHHWEVKGPSPPFPYIPGFSIKIRPYAAPTKAERQTQIDAEKSLKARYPPGKHKIPAIEYCMATPYYELETGQASETSHQIKEHILHVDSIVTRPASDIWWNMVQCHLDNDIKSRCTAKIYDPVYSSYVQWAHIHANGHINSEAKAYARFSEAGISGKVTPVFLGVWIMDVPIPSRDFGGVDYATSRSVPLLLFEQVEAANLASTYLQYYYTSGYVEPQPQLPQAWRREVLAKIYEARALLDHAGVHAHAPTADGIFVRTIGMEDGRLDVRVVIADFEMAHISKDEERTEEPPDRPVSPIETCWNEVGYGLEWLAWDEWREDEDLKYYRQWLVQRWGESTYYRPLSEDMRKRIACGDWEEVPKRF